MRDASVTSLQNFLVVFFTIMMVSSVSVGVVAADGVTLDEIDDGDVEPADEIYVTDDGAVLVYDDDDYDSSEVNELSFGGDVSTGLVNAFVEYEDEDTEDIEGDAGMTIDQDSISAATDLTIDPGEDFDEFTFTADGEHTQDTSDFEADAYIEFGDADEYPSVTTSGDIELGSDAFEADMSFESVEPHAGEFETSAEVLDFSLEQTDDGYDVTMAEERPVNQFNEDQWDTEEDAYETLQAQASGIAHELDASADVTIHSYDYTEGDDETPGELDIEYTIELTGVGDSLGELIAQEMANDPMVDLTDEEIDAVSDGVNDLQINHIDAEVLFDSGETAVDVSVSFEDYEEAMLTYMDAVADEDGLVSQDDVDEFETVTDARSSADMTQTMSWDGALESTNDGGVVTAEVRYDTENWDDYVTELEDGGIEHNTEATFSADVTGDGDEVDVDATFDVNRDDLIDEALDEMLGEIRNDASVDEEEIAFLEAFDDSDIQVAKSDIVFGEDTVEVRAAGQFDDLTAFNDVSDDVPDDLPVTHVYGEDANDTAEMYVSLEGLEDADADAFSESAFADDDTDVHADGDWDRDFPEMDTQEVADYLDVDIGEEDEETSESIPGFGVVVALISLIAAALFATRRRSDD